MLNLHKSAPRLDANPRLLPSRSIKSIPERPRPEPERIREPSSARARLQVNIEPAVDKWALQGGVALRRRAIHQPDPPPLPQPSLLETLTLASELATTCVVPPLVCLFLLSLPRSATLASAHTEPTICPSLLFGARQMEKEEKKKSPQKNKPTSIFFFH